MKIAELKENSNNIDFYNNALAESGLYLEWASDEIKDNKEMVMKAVTQNPGALEFASSKLKNDKDIFLFLYSDLFLLKPIAVKQLLLDGVMPVKISVRSENEGLG